MFKSNNIIKRLTLLIMSIILILTTIPLQSSYVHAYNGEQGGGEEGAGGLGNGVSVTRTGFLFYIADEEGQAQTRSITISPNAIPFDSIDASRKLYATKAGAVSHSASYPIITPPDSNAPTPVVWTGSAFKANGLKVKEWLLTPTSSGLPRYELLIKKVIGEDVLTKVREHAGEWYIWVEPFAWTKLWINGKCDGHMWFATASNWAQIYIDQGQGDAGTGDKQIHGFTHKALPYSMVLEYDMSFPKYGLNFHGHAGEPMRVLSNSLIQSDGYGLHIIPTESNGIHTYNGVDSPGNPETNDPPRDGTCNIVKGYYTEKRENGVVTGYTDDGTYSTLMCTNQIIIDDEPNYELVRWDISTTTDATLKSTNGSSITWNPPATVSESGTTSTMKRLEGTQKCVYVLLRKVTDTPKVEDKDFNYKLTESTITRRVWFSAPDNAEGMKDSSGNLIDAHDFDFKKEEHDHECGGHPYSCSTGCTNKPCDCTGGTCTATNGHGTYCPGHTANCDWGKWTDMTMRFSLLNSKRNDYPNVLATKSTLAGQEVDKSATSKRWETTSVSWTDENDTAHIPAYSWGTDVDKNWDYIAILLRGSDKLTVAEWINKGEGRQSATSANTDLKDVSTLSDGFKTFAIADTDSGTRKTATYYETFSAHFGKDSSGDYDTTYAIKADSGHGSCNTSPSTKTASISAMTINTITVKIETYSGSSTTTQNDMSCAGGQMVPSKTASPSTSMVSGVIKFIPYIQMKYDTMTHTNKTAYVLSEFTRSMTGNDYAELIWDNSPGKLTISSGQWSIHAQPVADHGNNNVLPGGAQLELEIKPADRKTVKAISYQTVIKDAEDKGRTHIDKTGTDGGLTEARAKLAHADYVASVTSGFENTCVEQWVDKDDTKSTAFGGIRVYPGCDISSLNNGASTASTDDKYYLREDGTPGPSNEGDLDVRNDGTTTDYYTFYSDTKGNIYMNTTKILTQGQTESSLSGVAKEIDDRTYVVRKLIKAIERGTGNDSTNTWSGNSKWYNEAMDGVTVMKQTTTLTIGFNVPAQRVTIMDPKLDAKSSSKKDMFTKYHISQYRTKNYSEVYGESKPYVVGLFKGAEIHMPNLEKLFVSRTFYLTNVTTQDLR